nr:MAG TPA: hypothetical protein [Caudoviricetes sp.]
MNLKVQKDRGLLIFVAVVRQFTQNAGAMKLLVVTLMMIETLHTQIKTQNLMALIGLWIVALSMTLI